MRVAFTTEDDGQWRNQLAAIASQQLPQAAGTLAAALDECLPLFAATLARSKVACPRFVENVAGHLPVLLDTLTGTDTTQPEKTAQVVHINAALSRFSSLAFAGSPPISATEAHYWSHSLLGIGTACLGLQNLANFIYDKLGFFKLPERVEACRKLPATGVPILKDTLYDHQSCLRHYLDDAPIEVGTGDPIPLIAYFSGRDGFKSNVSVLSVPLATVAAANTTRLSLLTVTHEVSHIVIGAMLRKLLPKKSDVDQQKRLCRLIKHPEESANRLELMQATLLQSFVILAATKNGNAKENKEGNPSFKADLSPDSLLAIIRSGFGEVTEIMVHVFDFMYFYASNANEYVEGIWQSWGSIPNIESRVSEYVTRTACALMTKHFIRPNAEVECLKTLREILKGIVESDKDNHYARLALESIQLSNECQLEGIGRYSDIQVLKRQLLVRFVYNFLFSPPIAAPLQIDPMSKGDESDHGGYEIRQGEIAADLFENPLNYVTEFTRPTAASARDSMILWQELAHYLHRPARKS